MHSLRRVTTALVCVLGSLVAVSAFADQNDGGVLDASAVVASQSPQEATVDTPLPTEWLAPGPMRCIRRGRLRGFCAGPRRVPQPSGEFAARANALGSARVQRRHFY
ncbi:MAG: hypothetical protein IPK60_22415 [Sandaracinaceae bacterium]|nr:hypothetical protein [Sandaracinaceae bacterium]